MQQSEEHAARRTEQTVKDVLSGSQYLGQHLCFNCRPWERMHDTACCSVKCMQQTALSTEQTIKDLLSGIWVNRLIAERGKDNTCALIAERGKDIL